MATINSIDDLLTDAKRDLKPGRVEVTVIAPSLTNSPKANNKPLGENPFSFHPNKNQPITPSRTSDDLIFTDNSEVSKRIRELCPWTQFEFPAMQGALWKSQIDKNKIFQVVSLYKGTVVFDEWKYSSLRGMDESTEIYQHILEAIVVTAKEKSAKIMGLQKAVIYEEPNRGDFGKKVSYVLYGFVDSTEEFLSTEHNIVNDDAVDWASSTGNSASKKWSQYVLGTNYDDDDLLYRSKYDRYLDYNIISKKDTFASLYGTISINPA